MLFLEDHYFRLMAGMRIVRMSIPMEFTMEFIESQILETARTNQCEASARVRMTVFRDAPGLYLPQNNKTSYTITAQALDNNTFGLGKEKYEVELYKDFHVGKHLLSSVKTTNKMLHITASIFAEENDFDNCLLINDDKNVTEAINGNLFLLQGNKLTTPPVSEGCVNGVMRRQLISLSRQAGFEVSEAPVSPFDLQKADEMFLTNVIQGIQPISQYRKKSYAKEAAQTLTAALNESVLNVSSI